MSPTDKPASGPGAPRASQDGSLRDRMGQIARQGPPKSKAKMWLWIIFGGATLIAGLAQVFQLTKSPVAERVLRERQEREAPKTGTPAAPAGMGDAPTAPGGR